MARCEECIHEKVCVIKAFPDAFENTEWGIKPCDYFKRFYDAKISEMNYTEQQIIEALEVRMPHDAVCGEGLILTFDGATGYFPKEFIIEAIKAYKG